MRVYFNAKGGDFEDGFFLLGHLVLQLYLTLGGLSLYGTRIEGAWEALGRPYSGLLLLPLHDGGKGEMGLVRPLDGRGGGFAQLPSNGDDARGTFACYLLV